MVRFSIPTLSDAGTLRDLSQALTARVRADDFRGLVLDMEGVKFVVSAFLNVLLTVDKEMRAEHKPIRVCSPSTSVRETFELTRLNKKFPLFDDLAGALAAIAE